MANSIIQENLKGLQKVRDLNTYQAVQNIQDQMPWQRRPYKQQKSLLEKAKEDNKDPHLALLYTFHYDVQLDNYQYYMITFQKGVIISSYFP